LSPTVTTATVTITTKTTNRRTLMTIVVKTNRRQP
jgi:hypothetical protein